MGTYAQGRQAAGSTFGPGRDVGSPGMLKQVPIQATAVASQDVVVYLPDGATLYDLLIDATVAPTGATVTLSGGTTVGGTQLFGATDVKTTARSKPTFTSANLAAMQALPHVAGQSDTPIHLRLAQTTPTAVGTFVVTLVYELNKD